MYTFIILCVSLFALSGIIFGKKIKDNQFAVYSIIVVGSLIGVIISNGIIGSEIPYTKVVAKERPLKKDYESFVIINNDTILVDTSNIKFRYVTNNDTIIENSLYVITKNKTYSFQQIDTTKINIILATDTLTTTNSSVIKYKYLKLTESNWVSTFGLPSNGENTFTVILINDEGNRKLIEFINEKFYGKTKI